MIDNVRLREIVNHFFVPQIMKELGELGASSLRAAMETATRLYLHVDETSVKGGIIIIAPLPGSKLPILEAPRVMTSFEPLGGRRNDSLIVKVLSSQRWEISEGVLPDPFPLSRSAVVYRFYNGFESFYANEKEYPVPSGNYVGQSLFAVTAFQDLQSALDFYDNKLARCSSCIILSGIWHDPGRRFLCHRPEKIMRRSLTQFLKSHLRGDVEVRPEQSMDESHPIDVKVTWFNCNRLAIIEIKWLGQSKKKNGSPGAEFTLARANEGAKQLADYLDKNRVQAPTHETRGYLVIYDARRRGNKPGFKTMPREDLFYYEKNELVFSPRYHEERSDYEVPRRIFLEPVHP